MPVDGPLKKQNSVKTWRYVWNQRHAGLTGSICQLVTEFSPPPPRTCGHHRWAILSIKKANSLYDSFWSPIIWHSSNVCSSAGIAASSIPK